MVDWCLYCMFPAYGWSDISLHNISLWLIIHHVTLKAFMNYRIPYYTWSGPMCCLITCFKIMIDFPSCYMFFLIWLIMDSITFVVYMVDYSSCHIKTFYDRSASVLHDLEIWLGNSRCYIKILYGRFVFVLHVLSIWLICGNITLYWHIVDDWQY